MGLDYAALTAELAAGHPVTGAYDADAATAAGQLNAVNVPQDLESLSGSQMWSCTDATEYAALTDAKKQQWMAFCGVDNITPVTNTSAAAETVKDIFGVGSATIGNLVALRGYSAAQSTLLGFGEITQTMVQTARGEI